MHPQDGTEPNATTQATPGSPVLCWLGAEVAVRGQFVLQMLGISLSWQPKTLTPTVRVCYV
jgi:hypothetical protein